MKFFLGASQCSEAVGNIDNLSGREMEVVIKMMFQRLESCKFSDDKSRAGRANRVIHTRESNMAVGKPFPSVSSCCGLDRAAANVENDHFYDMHHRGHGHLRRVIGNTCV